MTQTATAPDDVQINLGEQDTGTDPERRSALDDARRRLTPPPRLDPWAWLTFGLITLLAGVMRVFDLGFPKGKMFDETYYATDAHWLLEKGVEWNEKDNGPAYVVHPPLGKWLIGLGELTFGYNETGWRISAAVFGTASVLLIMLIARHLFGSTVLAGAAGLLLAFDGMHFVLSRAALLDIFLMFFILAAFGTAVLDRNASRRRWASFIAAGGDPTGRGPTSRPPGRIPWWRLATAVLIGCAVGVKWSALAFAVMILLLMLWWEIGVRRTAGAPHPIRDALLDEGLWMVAGVVLAVVVYTATWTGWFLSDEGFYRHRLAQSGQTEAPFIGALQNWWYYHEQAYNFHKGLHDTHTYQSWPWQWLLDARPVAFHYTGDLPCSATACSSEVLLLGTPALWWFGFLPALVLAPYFAIARRDWRGGAVVAMIVAGLGPWFYYATTERTMFFFYALPAEPFLVLAVVFVLGCLMRAPAGRRTSDSRLMTGAIVAGLLVLLVAANFAWLYPIFTGESIPYDSWHDRMLLPSWI